MRLAVYAFMSAEDIARAKQIAATRNGCKAHGVNHRMRADRNDQETHEMGALGEIAVARLLGGTLDEAARSGGDNGTPDVILPDGRGVNVKTRSRSGYDFLLDPGQTSLHAAYGVLCWLVGGMLTVEIAGWLTNDDLRQYGQQVNFGYGPRLALPYQRLRPTLGLVHYYQERGR